MSQPTENPSGAGAPVDPAADRDPLREHAETDVEGGAASSSEGETVPREHTEDPAEG